MICPMSMSGKIHYQCYKEQCAWYDEHSKECTIKRINADLELINENIYWLRNFIH